MRRFTLALAFILLAVPCAITPAFAQDGASANEQEMAGGLDLFARGLKKEAKAVFDGLLKKTPDAGELLSMRRRAGVPRLVELLREGGSFEKFARMLLNATAPTSMKPVVADAKVEALVGEIIDTKDWKALVRLDTQVGDRAVPFLLAHVKAGGDKGQRASEALRRLGPQVLLPLMETLHSGDDGLASSVATILGQIGDRRAAADLMLLAKQGGAAGTAASAALNNVPRGTARSAFDAYMLLADAYYHERRWVSVEVLEPGHLWRWEGGLKLTIIPPNLHGLFHAEAAALRALALQPDSPAAWSLLASIVYGQYARTGETLALAEARKDKAGMEIAQKTQAALTRHRGLGHAIGGRALTLALGKALTEGRDDVAAETARGLGLVLPTGSVPPRQLLRALEAKNSEVQFQAAQAIARMAPKAGFAEATKVLHVLEETLGQTGKRVVLIIDDNPLVRNQLSFNLRKAGMEVYLATNRAEGARLAAEWPAEDAILIDGQLPGVRDLVASIRKDPRMARVPIFGILSKGDAPRLRPLFEDRVIQLPLNTGSYLPAVKNEITAYVGEHKVAAESSSVEAAQTLASIDPRHSVFKLALARGGLIAALRRADAVRIPAMHALGRLADPTTETALQRVVADGKATPQARAAAAWALGAIFAKNNTVPHDDTVEVLMKGLLSGPPAVQKRCGEALGRANLKAPQRRDLLLQLRLQASETLKDPKK